MNRRILYITSPGARGRKEPLFDEIISLCPENDYSSILYLCPNQFILKEAKRDFFSFLKKNNRSLAFIPFRVFTLKGLALSLQESSGKGRVISEDMRVLILCEILKDRSTGYAALLSELLRKIRNYLPDKELSRFREDVKELIFEEKTFQRLENAVAVLQRYEEEVKTKWLIDPEESLKNLITSFKNPFFETLVVEGFYDPTPLELGVIKRLIESSKRVYIVAEKDTGLLSFFQSEKMGFERITLEGKTMRDSTICHVYPSMEEEVEGIARNVKALILLGVTPWRIVITFPELSKYLSMLKRIFKKYGIPVNIAEYDLSNTRPVVALEDMLTCIEEDYPRNEFLSFLSSPYFPGIHKTLKEWAVPYSYRAKMIKGRQSWLSLKDTLIATSEDGLTEEGKKRLSRFGREMDSIIALLEGIRQKMDMRSFIDSFESALDKLGFFESLRVLDEEIYTKILDRLSEFRCFAVFYRDAVFTDTPWFYLRQFLKGLKVYADDVDGVRVVPYESASGLEAEALFFGGLIEEDFPSKPAIDPLLPEAVKRAFGIPDLEYYINRQRQYFKRLLNISIKEPCLSYPSGEGDKLYLPSPFLNWEMITSPEPLNMFTDEDVLIAEGSLRMPDVASEILWDGSLPQDRRTLSLLKKRTEAISGGFMNVTDIDSYRRCPMRFYIEKVLGFELTEPPRFEVETRLWGSFAHKTMENLFRDGEVDLEDMENRLLRSLEEALKEFPIRGFWARVAKEIFRRQLPLMKRQEANLRRDGFTPYKVEERLIAEIDGLRLKGKIDRIDIKIQNKEYRIQNTEDGGEKSVVLLDYKTGLIDSDSLQLPLYAYMWQKTYHEIVEKTGFYSLREGHVTWFPKKITMEEFIQDALEKLRELINKLRKGGFPPEPYRANECRFCYHSALCRAVG